MKEKICCTVVGGSIAGCVTAALLSRLGMNVTILERSSGELKGQGAGITLPVPLVNKCIELDLFDKDIPRLSVDARSFFRKSLQTYQSEKIWDQPFKAFTLNWMDVYRNLRKRLHSVDFRFSENVTRIQKEANEYYLETASGMTFRADIVIAADGVDSNIRKQLLPVTVETYAGYIAWRGIIEPPSLSTAQQVPYYVFPHGHILLYRIPADGFEETGKTLLNWVMYEITPIDVLPVRLTDYKNNRHTRSIPQKTLHDEQKRYLHEFARQQLPPMVAQIICDTAHPFIQAVFDAQIQPYEDNQVLFMGDAATTLRPHSGSGVMKALSHAIDLYECITKNPGAHLYTLLSQWKHIQQKSNAEEIEKAKIMGKALVTETPSWPDMNQETMDAWWSQVMKAQNWYATQASSRPGISIFSKANSESFETNNVHVQAKL